MLSRNLSRKISPKNSKMRDIIKTIAVLSTKGSYLITITAQAFAAIKRPIPSQAHASN